MSKATPRGAVAKFAAGGKPTAKKDLSMLAVSYGNIYVAKVAFGAKDAQTIKAFREAESYNGPSLIIAYSNCIAHGYDMKFGLQQQQAAVDSGYWNLFRYDPRLVAQEKNPFQLDSRKPSLPLEKYMYREGRFRLLLHNQPDTADQLLRLAKDDVKRNWQRVEEMAGKEIRD
jgi:pyruvate-ferredoxin/flavodoxin oxidoreductase